VRAGAKAATPALAGVELADEIEQARGGGVEVGGELGDLVAETVEVGGTSGHAREGHRGIPRSQHSPALSSDLRGARRRVRPRVDHFR